MRYVALVITAIVLLLIDLVVLPFLSISGYYGSVLFVFFALFALRDDAKDAVVLGLLTGLLQEVYFPHGFGLHLLTNLFLFLALSKIGETLKEGRRIVAMVMVAVAQGVKIIVVLSLLRLFGIRGDWTAVLPVVAYTAVLAFFLYGKVRQYRNIPFIKKEWKF